MSIQIVKQKRGWQVVRYGVPDTHLYATKRVALEQIARMGEMNEYRRSQGQVAFGPGKRKNPSRVKHTTGYKIRKRSDGWVIDKPESERVGHSAVPGRLTSKTIGPFLTKTAATNFLASISPAPYIARRNPPLATHIARGECVPVLGTIQGEKTALGYAYRVWLGQNWSKKGTKAWAQAISDDVKGRRSNPSFRHPLPASYMGYNLSWDYPDAKVRRVQVVSPEGRYVTETKTIKEAREYIGKIVHRPQYRPNPSRATQVVAKKDKWGYQIVEAHGLQGGPFFIQNHQGRFVGSASTLAEAKAVRKLASGPTRSNPSLRKSPHMFHGDDEHEMRREHRSKSRRHIAKHGRGAMFPTSSTEGKVVYSKGLKALKASSTVKQMVGIKRKTQSILNNPGYYAGLTK